MYDHYPVDFVNDHMDNSAKHVHTVTVYQCWFNVGPASATLTQHQTSIDARPGVYDMQSGNVGFANILILQYKRPFHSAAYLSQTQGYVTVTVYH